MGRRYLNLLAALAVALGLAAPAGAGVRWHELARGTASGAPASSPVAFVALDRASTSGFSARLPAAARAVLAWVDFGRNAVVAVFGEFGCQDHRVTVSSIVQHASQLVVSLVLQPIPPGTMECMALFPTYRLLTVTKAQLSRPTPTRAEARLARA